MSTRRSLNWLLLTTSVLLLLIQCSTSLTEEQSADISTPVVLSRITEAQSVNIERRQEFGITIHPWITESYRLVRDGEKYVGEARFTIGQGEFIGDIEVPGNVMERSLQMLAEVPVKVGDYQPLLMTDGWRFTIRIELAFDGEQVVFLLDSPNSFKSLPWEVNCSGENYVIDSGIPLEALNTLQSYLRGEELERLSREFGAP